MTNTMSDHDGAYGDVEGSVLAWAPTRPDVHAMLVVGSRARADRPADEFSDLDIVLFADEPARLIDADDWLSEIGPVVMSFIEQTALGGWRERRAVFDPMLDVDFSVVPTSLLDLDFAVPGPVVDVIRPVVSRGYRILYDPCGRLTSLEGASATPATAWTPPDETAFTNVVIDFWYHAMWTTKKALRGELLVARRGLDNSMKGNLLVAIKWRARLDRSDVDTWHGFRFFEEWGDQDEVRSLHATYGAATIEHLVDDLATTMDLFSRVAQDVADRLGYTYPERAEGHVRDWIRRTVAETPKRS
ncbi:N/A [soil metagenome]